MTVLDRLKRETLPAHEKIERVVDLEARIASRESYQDLLARFYGFHAVWEREAEAILADPAFFDARRRTDLLVRDLENLGLSRASIAALPLCRPMVPLPSRAAAFGAMYVVEGSTLGGAVMARQIERVLGLGAGSGGAYFHGHGRDRGRMWQGFRARLLAEASNGGEDAIVDSAHRTFELMTCWLAR